MPIRTKTHRPHPGRRPRHQAEPAAPRPRGYWRLYNGPWRQARVRYLARHPYCVHCQAAGRSTPAAEVDHRIPHRGDQLLFWDEDNWQALCHTCHSRKTAREDGGFTGRPRRPGG